MLTERQKDVVGAIRVFTAMHGYAPTYRELAHILEITPHGVLEHLTRLRVAGVVAWNEGKARTIRLVREVP